MMESACYLWIQLTVFKASNGKLEYYRCCYPQQAVEQTIELPAIWYTMTLMWRHRNEVWEQLEPIYFQNSQT